ncbi:MAG: hypothetical protein IPG45_12705 [Deltaproteobacteria bacterium]|jgi:hypothetical protein|nr:hypothetical protein [Deltaproteobacteria bacterium]
MGNADPKSNLLVMHRVLMTMAIALGVLFTAYSGREFSRHGETKSLVISLATAIFTGVLVFYLRWFIKKNQARL